MFRSSVNEAGNLLGESRQFVPEEEEFWRGRSDDPCVVQFRQDCRGQARNEAKVRFRCRIFNDLRHVITHIVFMRCRFVDTGEMKETFPYRSKAMFAFEEINGIDVCFFGMHVQEYGSDAPFPNTRQVVQRFHRCYKAMIYTGTKPFLFLGVCT